MQFFGYVTPPVCCTCVIKSSALSPAHIFLQFHPRLGQKNREGAIAMMGKEPAQFVPSPKDQAEREENLPAGSIGSKRSTGFPLLFWLQEKPQLRPLR